MAREEAKQRERNRKDKCAQLGQQLKIHKLNLHKDDELLVEDVKPIILIQIGLERKIVKALRLTQGWIATPFPMNCFKP